MEIGRLDALENGRVEREPPCDFAAVGQIEGTYLIWIEPPELPDEIRTPDSLETERRVLGLADVQGESGAKAPRSADLPAVEPGGPGESAKILRWRGGKLGPVE